VDSICQLSGSKFTALFMWSCLSTFHTSFRERDLKERRGELKNSSLVCRDGCAEQDHRVLPGENEGSLWHAKEPQASSNTNIMNVASTYLGLPPSE